ncbi:alanine racemase C-terminal domain-containing protein [Microbacterium sp. NPDC057659]|uniref:alanine racemase C-terminal domain-containing protein n=1 Tax=Microbacterium sp. NPDC057659 TaxID=3346198 RepID=UPI00366C4148
MSSATNSALPRAVLSRAALAAAARGAAAAGGACADLRRDAWGHGLTEVAHTVTRSGIRQILVDDEETALSLREAGIDAVASGAPDVDPSMLFGLPGAGKVPVMRLVGTVMSTKRLRPGDAVSYGYTHRAVSDTTVALVTGGYAQGIVRALGNHARAEVDGVLRPIIGRVAMDVCVVDLEGVDAAEGAEVTYFGGTGPARETLADWARITGLTVGELVAVAGMSSRREWRA